MGLDVMWLTEMTVVEGVEPIHCFCFDADMEGDTWEHVRFEGCGPEEIESFVVESANCVAGMLLLLFWFVPVLSSIALSGAASLVFPSSDSSSFWVTLLVVSVPSPVPMLLVSSMLRVLLTLLLNDFENVEEDGICSPIIHGEDILT